MSPLHFQVRTIALTAIVLLATSARVHADVVIIHDRDTTIRLGDADAAQIARLGAELVRRSHCTAGEAPVDELRALRVYEVVVEVHFERPQEIELATSGERTRPQHLFIPLTGPRLRGADGEGAEMFGGHTSPSEEPHYLGLAYANPPDEYDVLYTTTYELDAGLDELRRAVARLGVHAPRPEPPHPPRPGAEGPAGRPSLAASLAAIEPP